MPPSKNSSRFLAARDYEAFMGLAVRSKKNIVVSGATGSGKTTFTKALIREIPREERLITIEDAPELVLNDHPNHVRLFYSKGDQGQAKVAPKQLLESCLRMRPDRILLAELRSDEAFDYLRNANSGHPGSITSVHASSAELAFEQLTLLVKQSRERRRSAAAGDQNLLYLLVDIVVQFGVVGHQRCIREVWYDPARKHALASPRLKRDSVLRRCAVAMAHSSPRVPSPRNIWRVISFCGSPTSIPAGQRRSPSLSTGCITARCRSSFAAPWCVPA